MNLKALVGGIAAATTAAAATAYGVASYRNTQRIMGQFGPDVKYEKKPAQSKD